MRYGITTKATDFTPPDWRIKLTKAVLFFIPAANPDAEALFPEVKKWFLEVDNHGSPMREIAVDGEGRVLFRSPDGKNVGFWTDSDAKFAEPDLVSIPAEKFEELWTDAADLKRKQNQSARPNAHSPSFFTHDDRT